MMLQNVIILILLISAINSSMDNRDVTRIAKMKDYGEMRCAKELDFCNTTCLTNNESVLHVSCKCNGIGMDHLNCTDYLGHRIILLRFDVINSINMLRRQVALGTAKTPNNIKLPTASNMRSINYNVNLEYVALCTANKCKAKRDICIHVKNFKFVQQLIFSVQTEELILETDLFTKALKFWMDDMKNNAPNVDNINEIVSGNWSNFWPVLLWASAHHIGCAMKYKMQMKKRQIFLVCNIAGDVNPEDTNTVYRIGKSCSFCKETGVLCNIHVGGLCGKILAVPIAEKPIVCNSAILIHTHVVFLFLFLNLCIVYKNSINQRELV